MPGNCEGLRGEGFWGFSVKGFGVPGLGCGCVGIWGFQVFIRTTQVPNGSHNLDENRLGQIGIGYGVRVARGRFTGYPLRLLRNMGLARSHPRRALATTA